MIHLKEIGGLLFDILSIFLRTLRRLDLFDGHRDAVATHRATEDHAKATHAENLLFIHLVEISEIFRVVVGATNHFEGGTHSTILGRLNGFVDRVEKQTGELLIDHRLRRWSA